MTIYIVSKSVKLFGDKPWPMTTSSEGLVAPTEGGETLVGDLSEADSLELIGELTEHATQPAYVYRHKWTVGDLVMWDNTSVMHRRTPFPADVPRHLKRAGFYLPDELATPF